MISEVNNAVSKRTFYSKQILSLCLLSSFFLFFAVSTYAENAASVPWFIDKSVQGKSYLKKALHEQENESIFHLFTHGKPGWLLIEDKWRSAPEIADWLRKKKLLGPTEQLNIYACSFAAGEVGKSAIDYLEASLNVSIAASDDVTGQGGDWTLEVGKTPLEPEFCDYPYSLQTCDCKEFIYLNEPLISSTLKFEVTNNVLLTEVPGANGLHWYPGTNPSELPSPHGLGTDLNGYLYIAASGGNSDIRRLDCDGNIFPTGVFNITDPDAHVNMFSIDNTLYTNNTGQLKAWDLCSATQIGQACLNNVPTFQWGMSYNKKTGTAYVTGAGGTNQLAVNEQRVWVISRADLENSVATGACIDPFIPSSQNTSINIGDNYIRRGYINMMGITGDNDGNIYLAMISTNTGISSILKYDKNGGYLGESNSNATINNVQGLVWSESTDRLYIASYSDDVQYDCIAVYDAATLNYLGVGAPNPDIGADNSAKTLAVNVECCPSNPNETVNIQQCVSPSSEAVFLNEIFPCDGIVCSAPWTPANAASTAVFDDCSQTINSGVTSGCYSFTRSGSASHPCGAFTQQLNVEIISVEDISITSDAACDTVTLTATTAAANIQWQHTTTAPFADDYVNIVGETATTLRVSPSEATHYRAVVVSNTTTASGNCPGGTCQLPSNVISIDNNIKARAFAIQASCVAGTPQNDGFLQLTEAYNGTHYNFSEGSTYSGSTDINLATAFNPSTDLPLQFGSGQTNPSGSRDYTIRIFNANGGACFIDLVVTMQEQDCVLGCDCEDYLYLNDVTLNHVYKFEIDEASGALTGIGSPWLPSSNINNPHGIATDNNGFLYINNGADNGTLAKLNCDGEVEDLNFATIAPQVFNFNSANGVLYLHNNSQDYIEAFDLCDGTSLGRMWANNGSNTFAWGFYMDDTNWYLPEIISGNIMTGSLDVSLYAAAPTNTGTALFNTGYSAPDQTYFSDVPLSLTRDDAGNFYLVINQIATTGGLSDVTIHKFSPTGTLLNTVNDNAGVPHMTDGLAGFDGGRGIVYSSKSGYLYFGNYENCVTVFNTDLVEQTALNIGNPTSGYAKGVGITTECCPTSNNQTVDLIQCVTTSSDPVFLNEVYPCESVVCGGTWTPVDASSAAVYEACNQSVNSGIPAGCYSFERNSDGTHPNSQCGAFYQRLNLEIIQVPDITVTVDQCLNTLTATTTSTDIQWQSSTTGTSASDFTDIPGAVSSTFEVGEVALPTYYRALVQGMTAGSGNCPGGNCDHPSNIISIDSNIVARTFAIQASCVNGSPMNDAYLQISSVLNGTHYNYSSGSTYTASADINDATPIDLNALPLQFAQGLNNPSGAQDYTIRIFNSNNNNCFRDYTVTLNEQDCTMGCTCNETIYLAEPTTNTMHKFRVNPNTSITEIKKADGSPWMTGLTVAPHGVGVDINGFLYIGNASGAGGVDKYNCDGDLLQEDVIPLALGDGMTGAAGFQNNIYTVGNTLYLNGWYGTGYLDGIVFAYDICTGSLLGDYRVCDETDNLQRVWDFHIDEENNQIILNTYAANRGYAIGDLTTNLNGPCIPVVAGTASGNGNGIVKDNAGNIYARGFNTLAKYDSGNNLLYNVSLSSGGANAWGMVYSETVDLLYVAGNDADCISIYDPADGSYVAQAFPNPPNASNNKAINILTECCPTNNNVSVDTMLCVTGINQVFFLQDLINCSGSICEGAWQGDPGNTGLSYNPCNNTVTVTATNACGSFTLESDGTGNNPQCGAFKLNVNISVGNISAPTIANGGANCANGNNPPAFSFNTPASGSSAITYRWQSSTSSCATAWTDIPGAPTDNTAYDPPALSQTTYYRVITSAQGGCLNNTCLDTSNCVVITPETDCGYSLGNRVFFDLDNDGLDSGENGVDGITLRLLNGDGSTYDSDPSTPGIQELTVITGNGGYYRFDDLPAGNYIVEIPMSEFDTGTTLERYASSTGTGQQADPDTDIDADDNGIDGPDGEAVRSGIISLGPNEPQGEQEPGAYSAGSSTGTAAVDEWSNLTVDFGFYLPRREDYPDFENPENPCNEQPCHTVSNDIYLGSGVTVDDAGGSSGSADTDEDDGVGLSPRLDAVPGNVIRLPVTVYNATGSNVYFRAWMDWNGDGDFEDANEQVYDNLLLYAIYSGSFTEQVTATIPADAVQNQDIALRLRLSTDDTNTAGPCGTGTCAADGEIEDYLLRLSCPSQVCTGLSITVRSD